ncbi:MAG: hypothetical protein ABW277_20940 [Longimicrobiaceae bacterium]
MRRRLMVLSALTCFAGSVATTAPASADAALASCEANYGKRCSGADLPCTRADGSQDILVCYHNTYIYF